MAKDKFHIVNGIVLKFEIVNVNIFNINIPLKILPITNDIDIL
jgi:hypothetical protein